ncbi:MAG TPA: alpha/beta fold hydrolase [Vicinamibacteria bacterium]
MIPFRPHPLTVGPHRQTLLGYWARRRLVWKLAAEDLWVEVSQETRLLLRLTWQPGRREDHPLLLVVHGLGGSDSATYAVSTGGLAFNRGFHVARMNMRGAGDSEGRNKHFYNAGLDTDVRAALEALAPSCSCLFVTGFSLGGSVSLLALGRQRLHLPAKLRGVAAVCPPLDLAACAASLESRAGRVYTSYFMRRLRCACRRRQRLHPTLYEAGREHAARTVREFDERITAPYGGYRDADDYYARSSAGPWLGEVDRPALVLAAEDDPMVPGESVRKYPLPASGLVRREILATGGHVGFVAQAEAPGRFWAADRVLEWFREVA